MLQYPGFIIISHSAAELFFVLLMMIWFWLFFLNLHLLIRSYVVGRSVSNFISSGASWQTQDQCWCWFLLTLFYSGAQLIYYKLASWPGCVQAPGQNAEPRPSDASSVSGLSQKSCNINKSIILKSAIVQVWASKPAFSFVPFGASDGPF